MRLEFVPEHCWKIVPEPNPPELPPESRLIIASGTESIQKVSSHRSLLPTNDLYDRHLLSTLASVPTDIVDYKIINDPNCCSYPAIYDIPLPLLCIISLSQIQNEIDIGKEQGMLSCRCYANVPLTDQPMISTKSMPLLVLQLLPLPYPLLLEPTLAFVLKLSPLMPILSLPQLLVLESPTMIYSFQDTILVTSLQSMLQLSFLLRLRLLTVLLPAPPHLPMPSELPSTVLMRSLPKTISLPVLILPFLPLPSLLVLALLPPPPSMDTMDSYQFLLVPTPRFPLEYRFSFPLLRRLLKVYNLLPSTMPLFLLRLLTTLALGYFLDNSLGVVDAAILCVTVKSYRDVLTKEDFVTAMLEHELLHTSKYQDFEVKYQKRKSSSIRFANCLVGNYCPTGCYDTIVPLLSDLIMCLPFLQEVIVMLTRYNVRNLTCAKSLILMHWCLDRNINVSERCSKTVGEYEDGPPCNVISCVTTSNDLHASTKMSRQLIKKL